jgi:hypothetical protein
LKLNGAYQLLVDADGINTFGESLRITKQQNTSIKLLKPTGHVTHQQFNIQQLNALPTLYLCVLYLSDNKQRLVPLTALIFLTEMKSVYSTVRTGSLNKVVYSSSLKS